jgi:hypothetical protein
MSVLGRAAPVTLAASVLLLSGCVGGGADERSSDTAPESRTISATVPPERLTPFCQTMITLTEELRSGEVTDSAALIVTTYRSIRPDVPAEIADDFDRVLAALESGAPPPTDPPPDTTATTQPSTQPTTQPSTEASVAITVETDGSVPTGDVSVDEGFAPGNSPAERINSYVSFVCRDTANNPGPPATQPLEPPPTDAG